MRGIYIVANDRVANQLIALLNSFEKNWQQHPIVCIIPYNQNIQRVKEIVKEYETVVMFDDEMVLEKLDIYFGKIWMECSEAVKAWKQKNKHVPHRIGEHRRFIALTEAGLFDEFMYIDVDTYVNRSFDELFDLLQHFDVVAHDYQHKGPEHVFNTKSPALRQVLNGNLLDQIQCTGLIVSKKSLMQVEHWNRLPGLVKKWQEVLYPWAPDQTLWNLIHNVFKWKFVNLVRHWPAEKVTCDAQTYTKFQFNDGKLYQDGREILYFHHIGVPAEEFNRICNGKEPRHQFRYQEVFKYFRYLDRHLKAN